MQLNWLMPSTLSLFFFFAFRGHNYFQLVLRLDDNIRCLTLEVFLERSEREMLLVTGETKDESLADKDNRTVFLFEEVSVFR